MFIVFRSLIVVACVAASEVEGKGKNERFDFPSFIQPATQANC